MRTTVTFAIGVFMTMSAAFGQVKIDKDMAVVPTLVATGRGEVLTTPDRATVRLGATAQAADAATAQGRVNDIVSASLAALKDLKIPEEAIKTEGIQLFPIYANQKRNDEGPRVTGYRAANVISIRLDDLKQVGPAIDAGVKSGANEIQGVTFEVKNDSAFKQDALRKAIAEARGKADAMAGALGVQLMGPLEVSESGSQPVRPMMMARGMMAGQMAAEATPVQAGQMTIEASVTISYRIGELVKGQ